MSRHRTQPQPHQAALYAIVFGNLYVKVAAITLLGFMLLQPVGQVLAASEDSTTTAESVSTPATTSESDTSETEPKSLETNGATEAAAAEPEPEPEPEPESDTTDEEESAAAPEETNADGTHSESPDAPVPVTQTTPTTKSTSSDTVENSTPTPEPTSESVTATLDEAPPVKTNATTTKSSSTEPTTTSGAGGATNSTDTATSSTASPNQNRATSVATTTQSTTTTPVMADATEGAVVPETTPESEAPIVSKVDNPILIDQGVGDTAPSVQSDPKATTSETAESEPNVVELSGEITNADNRYQFGEAECVSVGDGSFYCNQQTGGLITTGAKVYAAVDEEGDYEIYFNDNGSAVKITDNLEDDRSPYYDEVEEQIVWHRLTGGRYQIMRYDLNSKETETLSDNEVNNMEPTQADGVTVWQRWVDDNWEIAMHDGTRLTVITDNEYHDVAPSVKNGYVMWHTTSDAGEKLLSVYEIETGLTSVVKDPDGGYVENPRFVLVYDTTFENGDRITKQYDPITGEIVPVSSEPARPTPPTLPDPEPAGEATVLQQNKNPNPREDFDDDVEPSRGTTTLPTPDVTAEESEVAGESASEPTDLVIPANEATSSEETLPLSEFDLIVEPYVGSSSAQTGNSATTTDGVE